MKKRRKRRRVVDSSFLLAPFTTVMEAVASNKDATVVYTGTMQATSYKILISKNKSICKRKLSKKKGRQARSYTTACS